MKQHLILIALLVLITNACTIAQSEEKSSTQQTQNVQPALTGGESITIGTKVKFYSEILKEEKELYLSLPPKYNEHVHNYPVIFTFEAEYLFEATSTIVKYMASRSKMPESIVVSIANVDFDKRNEANYERWGGKPDEYLQFFEKELIPYIEENYRTNSHKTIIGLSPSSGFLYEAFVRKPGIFDAYIALSAHLEWDRVLGTPLFDEIIAGNNVADYPITTFFLARAKSDFPGFKGSKEAFEKAEKVLENYRSNRVKIKIDVLEDEEHYLMALAGIRSGLEAIYPNDLWRNPGIFGWDKSANYAQTYYKDYYDKLSSIYGFNILPVEDGHGYGYNFLGRLYSAKRWGTNQQLIDLAKLGISYFPNSAAIHMFLAEALNKEGETILALETAEKAVQLVSQYNPGQSEEIKMRLNEMSK